jgi:hypothetical protein
MDLTVSMGGIPHLAKNERDVGHPSFVEGTKRIKGLREKTHLKQVPKGRLKIAQDETLGALVSTRRPALRPNKSPSPYAVPAPL